ncbi:MAG: hypothetical protein FD167_3559 [bacterium]|nr:MAG: hypothetical protein FD167_3559 [bacterium]
MFSGFLGGVVLAFLIMFVVAFFLLNLVAIVQIQEIHKTVVKKDDKKDQAQLPEKKYVFDTSAIATKENTI